MCSTWFWAPGGSVAEGQPVLARLRAADQHAALVVDPDRLGAAQRLHRPVDDVAAGAKIGGDLPADRALQLQHALIGEAARRLGRLLRVEALIEEARQERGMAARLVLAAHDAERHHRA